MKVDKNDYMYEQRNNHKSFINPVQESMETVNNEPYQVKDNGEETNNP